MTRSPAFSRLRIRLVPEPSAGRLPPPDAGKARSIYRPLAIGAAVVVRPHSAGGRWIVAVAAAGLVQPRGLRSLPEAIARARGLAAAGLAARAAVALLTPEDLVGRRTFGDDFTDAVEGRQDCYGWSLLYQLPGMRGTAFVDPHERLPELPAFYESPLECLDRAAHLAEHGIPSRALALVAQPDDVRLAVVRRSADRFEPGGSQPGRHWPGPEG